MESILERSNGVKRLSLFIVTFILASLVASQAMAKECIIGKNSIPEGVEGFKKALRKAKSGDCTSDDVEWRNRYEEFFPGTTRFQVIRFNKSANLTVSENLPQLAGHDSMPTVIVADDDVDVTIISLNLSTGLVIKGDRIVIDHIKIEDFRKEGVRIEGSRNLIIRDQINSNGENGIVVTGKNNWIVDSEIRDNGINGILVGGSSVGGNCGGSLSYKGQSTTIKGCLIHDNGQGLSGSSCTDVDSIESVATCSSLKLEVEQCYEKLLEEEVCEEPSVPMDDACGRYWISRNRCVDLWLKLNLDEESSLEESITAMFDANPGAHGGHGVSIDAVDVRILSWTPEEDPLNEAKIFNNKSFGVYVNTMTPAAICQDASSEFDIRLVQTALISETSIDDLAISRYSLPVVSQLASTAGINEITVSGTVRLTSDPSYLWNISTVSLSALKGEVFIKDQDSGNMSFVGSANVDNDGRFVVHLTPPLTINGMPVSNPVFVATLVDEEHGNTSPFLGAHTASPESDDDGDGLENSEEDLNQNGVVDPGETDPLNPDTDGDGLMDGEEKAHNGRVGELLDQGFVFASLDRLDPLNPDSDNDCLPDGLELGVSKEEVEYLISQMPEKPRLNLSSRCQKILNDSTVTTIENAIWYNEIAVKSWNNVSMLFDLDPESFTDPTSSDTDQDGVLDGAEDVNFNGKTEINGSGEATETDPASSDSDGDGIIDGEEGDRDGDGRLGPDETDPLLSDTDGDGLNDGQEKRIGTYPNACDSDEDGLSDGVEMGAIKPASADSSCHGLEAAGTNYQNPHILDPLNPDSDNDGRMDGVEDENGNGWVDSYESDPSLEDSDYDGLSDGVEAKGDFNGDNIPDFDLRLITGGPKCSPPEDISDIDCDGIPNWIDVDSDDDGCPDIDEGGRRDINANGVPDVFDNEANGCSASGGGGSVSFGGSGSEEEDGGGAIGAAPSWLTDKSGGGACSLHAAPFKLSTPVIIGYLLTLFGLLILRCNKVRFRKESVWQRIFH